jgi:hypothetical protein
MVAPENAPRGGLDDILWMKKVGATDGSFLKQSGGIIIQANLRSIGSAGPPKLITTSRLNLNLEMAAIPGYIFGSHPR